jgi:tetratricopeptide (TPR) repeat protein
LKWLKSLQDDDDKKKFTYSYGLAFFDSNDFDQAIEVFNYLISEKEEDTPEHTRYFLGYSYYKLGQIDKASNHFSYKFTEAPFKSRAICLGGICKLRQGSIEGGLSDLEKVIDDKDSFTAHNALFNLARHLEDKDSPRALELLHKLDDSISDEKNNTLKVLSLYSQYEIYTRIGDIDKSNELLIDALNFATPSERFAIKLEMCAINTSSKNKADLVSEVTKNSLIFNSENELKLNFDESSFIRSLSLVYDHSNPDLFYSLIDYAVGSLRIDEQKKYEVMFNAGMYGKGNKYILQELTKYETTINVELSLKLYRILSIYSQHEVSFINWFTKFDKLSKNLVILDESDLYVYGLALQELFTLAMYKQILEISSDIEYRLSTQSCIDTMLLTSSAIHFWKGAVYNHIDQHEKALFYFVKTSLIIEESKFEDAVYFKKSYFSSISGYELKIKAPVFENTNLIQRKKFIHPEQMNQKTVYTQKQLVSVKYLDGTIKKGKYKRFSVDIKTLKCEVINE